ncbi:hypothetical protein CAMSH0001_0839 [Campylobacter showae RM3277]|uniref:Uncharacterized protein n=1 Tax=Campylobacter showae RM3277 TaxID=553219 RepID=C6RHL2_9BACT|nr:hypothetical protein CAMSH0001_0839 [Campylobacter showae RM3277]
MLFHKSFANTPLDTPYFLLNLKNKFNSTFKILKKTEI